MSLLSPSAGQRRQVYPRGAAIIMAPDTVLEIEHGVVAKTVIHLDGAEVLLGLHSAGQILTPHPEDSCHIRLEAHTEVHAYLIPWQQVVQLPNVAERLRAQIWQQEAWAAVQARPDYEARVVGVLSLLAEQFGVVQGENLCIDIRLTHQQLANAIGSTRPTVTRILTELRRRGNLDTIGTGNRERFCLKSKAPTHTHLFLQ